MDQKSAKDDEKQDLKDDKGKDLKDNKGKDLKGDKGKDLEDGKGKDLKDSKPQESKDDKLQEQGKANSKLTTDIVPAPPFLYGNNPKAKDIISEVDQALEKLYAGDLASVAIRIPKSLLASTSYPILCVLVVVEYAGFFIKTWAWTLWNVTTLPLAPLDFVSQIFWANLSTTLLFSLGLSCLLMRMPIISHAYQSWSKNSAQGLSLVNAAKPDMFSSLSDEQAKAAREAMSAPFKNTDKEGPADPSTEETYINRTFNLDVAKTLLLCASMMYERDGLELSKMVDKLKEYAQNLKNRSPDFDLLSLILSCKGLDDLKQKLEAKFKDDPNVIGIIKELKSTSDVEKIRGYAAGLGLQFHLISELNSQGTACVGLFYHPLEKFIILAFKGTSASAFEEWMTDCNFRAVEGGSWLRGFGNVQKGFMDRMFPAVHTDKSRLPYDSIRLSVAAVSKILSKHNDDAKINVYFTGHSLGCAMTSLAYARANAEPKELGKDSQVRDGYIFAAPLMCDVRSVNAFNNSMYKDPSKPRTLWRITQGRDLVATGLPAGGDHPNTRLSPFNLFGFAHLGTELTMRPPNKSYLAGNHLVQGCAVNLYSAVGNLIKPIVTEAGILPPPPPPPTQDQPNLLLTILTIMGKVPLVGRMVDHCPYKYYDQLSLLEPGEAKWVRPDW